ncbi:helix-turn-helix transcriptional regulator [Enterobacter sp. Bisph1]|uniref:helix-turn-helix domain-containing protein n=1 Tax=Enterobacter sp. Bisph1 TaxID=1274399 RepID=UPI0006909EA8|nr:helix-turn-helix transcriptional regulator [Enterobacter sp. Bisph1]
MTIISAQMKKLREAKGLSQTELSQLLNVLPRVYNRWERGHMCPQLSTVIKLADIFDVSIDELVGRPVKAKEIFFHNKELHLLCALAGTLSHKEQKALSRVMKNYFLYLLVKDLAESKT